MDRPILYRKRIIPDECILLKDDVIVSCDEDRIVTTWKTLSPRKDFHHGSSCYFLKEGFKVSKFCLENDEIKYWYCDIVDYSYDNVKNELIVTDLLADVIIYPDGFVKVVDVDELVEALNSGALTLDALKNCLLRLNSLLTIIYSGHFDDLKKYIQ